MTHEKYLADRMLLDDLNRRIDEAPPSAKPVFRGIIELHDRVRRYEKEHGLAAHTQRTA